MFVFAFDNWYKVLGKRKDGCLWVTGKSPISGQSESFALHSFYIQGICQH